MNNTDRRKFLKISGVLGAGLITGLATSCTSPKVSQKFFDRNFIASNKIRKFPRLEVSLDRIIKETVGLRPFRKNGFRLEQESLGNKTVVHNYGHGGSGWSLSWGTGNLAAELAESTLERKFAVLGSGVVGLTTARLLQLRGHEVTIYTKALPPLVTSSKATGTWSPGSRLLETSYLTPEFEATWRKAAHYSFRTYQNLLGLGDVVNWIDGYVVRDNLNTSIDQEGGTDTQFAPLRIDGLLPDRKILNQKEHPFHVDKVSMQTTMVFNIPSYLNRLISDFHAFGGHILIKEFKSLEEIDALPEKCVLNCTGLGSMQLFNDVNMTPIAGQLSFLIPQPDFNYRIATEGASAIPRKDGIVLGGNGLIGSWDENPSKEQTEKVVYALQTVMNRMRI
ncbi:MAG TPA: FAD-dependent oxidoreductase [Cyclobacteriaceae bacterium]|nr:FAD-dependent oxidoreductase [Cyclobacteriaceae bacterium]